MGGPVPAGGYIYRGPCLVRHGLSCDRCKNMIWAAFTLTFFGCLRAGEVVPAGNFDPDLNLTRQDVSFSNVGGDRIMSVKVRHSKTDVYNKGFEVVISCVPHVACAPCAMLTYLESDPHATGIQPLFKTPNGTFLNKTLFSQQLKLYMSALRYDSQSFSGHSFRSGCATSAAAAGFLDWEIKLLGRWVSDSYQGYIRAPRQVLANFSKRMVNKNQGICHHNIQASNYVTNSI